MAILSGRGSKHKMEFSVKNNGHFLINDVIFRVIWDPKPHFQRPFKTLNSCWFSFVGGSIAPALKMIQSWEMRDGHSSTLPFGLPQEKLSIKEATLPESKQKNMHVPKNLGNSQKQTLNGYVWYPLNSEEHGCFIAKTTEPTYPQVKQKFLQDLSSLRGDLVLQAFILI